MDKRIKRDHAKSEVLDWLSTVAHLCLEIHAGDTSQQASKKPPEGWALPSQVDEGMAAHRGESLLRVWNLGERGAPAEAGVQRTEAPGSEEDRPAPN